MATKRTSGARSRARTEIPLSRERGPGIRLAEFDVAEFTVHDRPGIDDQKLNITSEITVSADAKNGRVLVSAAIAGAITAPRGAHAKARGGFRVVTRTTFEVDGRGTLKLDADGTTTLPDWMAATAVGISYSMARGVLTERLAGTAFADTLLPILGLRELFPEIQSSDLDVGV